MNKYRKIRNDCIREFSSNLSQEWVAELCRVLYLFPEKTRACFVRKVLETAFIAAGTLSADDDFEASDLLFSIAALPHDTDLDHRIEELAEQPDERHMIFSWWEKNYGRDLADAVRGLCGVAT